MEGREGEGGRQGGLGSALHVLPGKEHLLNCLSDHVRWLLIRPNKEW